MAATPIVCGKISVDLKSSPINRDWIVEGSPTARNALLAQSRDRKSCTLVWDCTPGKFVWHYDIDETIHILEGSIVLDDGVSPPRRLGPGDVVFFPAGAVVQWTVETHVRKLAFFRRQMPKSFEIFARVVRKAKTVLRSRRGAESAAPAQPGGLAPGMSQRVEGTSGAIKPAA